MSDFFDDDDAKCVVCKKTELEAELMLCRKCGAGYICLDCFDSVGCEECGYGT